MSNAFDPIIVAEVILDGDWGEDLTPEDRLSAFPQNGFPSHFRDLVAAIKRLYALGGEEVPATRWQQFVERLSHGLLEGQFDHDLPDEEELIQKSVDRDDSLSIVRTMQEVCEATGVPLPEERWRKFLTAQMDQQWLGKSEGDGNIPQMLAFAQQLHDAVGLPMTDETRLDFCRSHREDILTALYDYEGPEARQYLQESWPLVVQLSTPAELQELRRTFIDWFLPPEGLEFQMSVHSVCDLLCAIEEVLQVTPEPRHWLRLAEEGYLALVYFDNRSGERLDLIRTLFQRGGQPLQDDQIRADLLQALDKGEINLAEGLAILLGQPLTWQQRDECQGFAHLRAGSYRRALQAFTRAQSKTGLLRLADAARGHGKTAIASEAAAAAGQLS